MAFYNGLLGDSLDELLSEAEEKSGSELHPLIKKHQKDVKKALQKIPPKVVSEKLDFEKIGGFEFKVGPVTVRQLIPFGLIGEAHEHAGNTELALKFLSLQIKHGANPRVFIYVFQLLEKHNLMEERYDDFQALLRSNRAMFKDEHGIANDLALVLMNLGKWKDAKWVIDEAERAFKDKGDWDSVLAASFKMNKIQIKVHTNKKLSEADRKSLTRILQIDNPFSRLGAQTLLEHWDKAEEELEKCLSLGNRGLIGLNSWPIISLLKPHLKKKDNLTKLEKTAKKS